MKSYIFIQVTQTGRYVLIAQVSGQRETTCGCKHHLSADNNRQINTLIILTTGNNNNNKKRSQLGPNIGFVKPPDIKLVK